MVLIVCTIVWLQFGFLKTPGFGFPETELKFRLEFIYRFFSTLCVSEFVYKELLIMILPISKMIKCMCHSILAYLFAEIILLEGHSHDELSLVKTYDLYIECKYGYDCCH